MSTDNIRYQERTSPGDNIPDRVLLFLAPESEAENEEERSLLIEYKKHLRRWEDSRNYFYEDVLRDLEKQQPIKNIIAREREKANKSRKEVLEVTGEKQAFLDQTAKILSEIYHPRMNVDRHIKNTIGKPINIKLKPSATSFTSKPQPQKDEPDNIPVAPIIGIGILVILLFIIVIGFLSA